MRKMNVVAEPDKQEIIITRVFDAPAELVFKTWTDKDLIPQWWGPSGMTTIVEQSEARKGGVWKYIHRDGEGHEFVFTGVYHEVVSPNLLINTYEVVGFPGVGLVTTTFEQQPDGKTKLTETSLYPSEEVRNSVLESGMTEGAAETMDRFEELLAKLQTNAR